MRICIVGGIFGKPPSYQRVVSVAIEPVLADGLRARGHEVTTASHHAVVDYSQFDIVHVHHLARGAIAAAVDRSRTPLVFTAHNSAASWSRRVALDFVQTRSDALVDLAVALAHDREEIARRHGIQHTVIYTGIPAGLFRARTPEPPAPGEPWRLLHVGQLIRTKRIDLLLRAVGELSRAHDLRLDLIYQTRSEEEHLRTLAAQLGIADRVDFHYMVSPSDLAPAYGAAHLVVLPSVSEFVPSVLTEAMMCGTPVVATSVGAIPEQVDKFGVVVKPGDLEELTAGISGVIEGYSHYAALALEMADSARRRFSVEAMVKSHEALYGRLLATGTRSRRSRLNVVASLPMRAAFRSWSIARPVRSAVLHKPASEALTEPLARQTTGDEKTNAQINRESTW